jgi:hypothetical protein
MVVYTPEAGSKSEPALSLLRSFAGAIPGDPVAGALCDARPRPLQPS